MDGELLVLVDESDIPVGSVDKMTAHHEGLLHRAFSVFLFDDADRMLLQKRASTKYHSRGLWSNACCGHPRPGEHTDRGANRRLGEELGISCSLRHLGSFRYRAELSNGLIEHEIDHVFVGRFSGSVQPNPEEVDDWRWIDVGRLQREMADDPARFTAWFGMAADKFGLIDANPSVDQLFIPANESPDLR